MEEWMGRLHIAVECNYQEVDRELKEQFIHGLNDKHMLEEIIIELTATNNDDHTQVGVYLLGQQEWRDQGCRQQCSIH